MPNALYSSAEAFCIEVSELQAGDKKKRCSQILPSLPNLVHAVGDLILVVRHLTNTQTQEIIGAISGRLPSLVNSPTDLIALLKSDLTNEKKLFIIHALTVIPIKTMTQFHLVMKQLESESEKKDLCKAIYLRGQLLSLIHQRSDLEQIGVYLDEKDNAQLTEQYKRRALTYYETKEMAHVLGLADSPGTVSKWRENMDLTAANQSSKERFKKLSKYQQHHIGEDINLEKRNFFADDYSRLTQHGAYQGFHKIWDCQTPAEAHAFTFYQIRDGEKIHLIYVNRGRSYLDDPYAPHENVLVFTMNPDEVESAVKNISQNGNKLSREFFSQAISNDLMKYKNIELTNVMRKSSQKVSNCSIANSNIGWHIMLASSEMQTKSPPPDFKTAYEATKPDYKRYRKLDRAVALNQLISVALSSGVYKSDQEFIADLRSVMFKLYSKHLRNEKSGEQDITFVLQHLNQGSTENLVFLYYALKNECFNSGVWPTHQTQHECMRFLWAKEIHQLLLQDAPSDEKYQTFMLLIEDDLKIMRAGLVRQLFNGATDIPKSILQDKEVFKLIIETLEQSHQSLTESAFKETVQKIYQVFPEISSVLINKWPHVLTGTAATIALETETTKLSYSIPAEQTKEKLQTHTHVEGPDTFKSRFCRLVEVSTEKQRADQEILPPKNGLDAK